MELMTVIGKHFKNNFGNASLKGRFYFQTDLELNLGSCTYLPRTSPDQN